MTRRGTIVYVHGASDRVAQPGITDHRVDLGAGFPDSHGAAYLDHPDVHRAIVDHPALSTGDGGAWGRALH